MKNKIVKIAMLLLLVLVVNNTHIVRDYNIPEYRRLGHLYIEFDYGLCYNDSGDGVLVGELEDGYYNYIYYPNASEGDCLVSVFVYNPFTRWNDDAIARYDFFAPVSVLAQEKLEMIQKEGMN